MKPLVAAVLLLAAASYGHCQAPAKPTVPDYGGSYNVAPAPTVMVAPTAGPRCPWMNLGTAAGFLGGEMNLSLVKDSAGTVTDCRFTRVSGKGELLIQVTVPITASAYRQKAGAACPAQSTPLRAIGNEAIECRLPGAALVVGRVRDQFFSIKVTGPDNAAATTSAKEAAEQVSGNLF